MSNRVLATVAALGLGGLILLSMMITTCYGDLQVGFYNGKCGNNSVEAIILSVLVRRILRRRDPTSFIPALIRMQFQDCFVKGCDASILIDGPSSEKSAPPNLSVRGYDIIDEAKKAVEDACPGLVSCADIIAIAARDAVNLGTPGFVKGRYEVETGRRDGLVSDVNNVIDIPGPSIPVSDAIALFKKKGLTTEDMVVLLGGHTVGYTHCSYIKNRLYNFNNTGKRDPSMDISVALRLKIFCPQNSDLNISIPLDGSSPARFDKLIYLETKGRRGILQIDQAIALDNSTRDIVTTLANGQEFSFHARFSAAMVKMGAIEVLTGTQGQIRTNCRVVNK